MDHQLKHLTNRQFDRYCTLVYSECGIKLNEEKRALLNARIAKRLRSLNVSPDRYYDQVLQDPEEMARFIDAVSTNHTYFFRESNSFKYVQANRPEIWCAACSSGEEPYSLAAHCLDLGGSPSILATDISDTCLNKARLGIYADQCVKHIPAPILKTYFQKGLNGWTGTVRVRSRLRQLVTFKKFNLLKDRLPDETFDVIFCRNVMIYFDSATKEQVVARLVSVLKPNGYFIIGGAESLNGLKHELRYIEPSVYLKKGA
ncbi:CheR family methyltransferase [Desulfosarcina sp.]|uniref:CheR family methyltransferase n=1 Tax=Desulfosarcina sp. TaxID=2027861 RepID=UPI003970CEF1